MAKDSHDWRDPCLCTLSQTVLGDGCYICNPERYRELCEEEDDEEE